MKVDDLKKRLLEEYTLVALPDKHNEPSARSKAEELIESGLVKRFFIEWKHTATGKNGLKLNNYLSKNIGKSYTDIVVTLMEEGYFEGIAKGDASPTIPSLAALAASKGAQVVAMDMDPTDVKSQLGGDESTGDTILFSPEGIKVRDEFAGKEIAKFLLEGPTHNGSLMLWGVNHFWVGNDEYGKGIDKIIEECRIKRDGKDVYGRSIIVVVDDDTESIP